MTEGKNAQGNLVHIFAQREYHGSAYIIGNKEGLSALRDAIDEAIRFAGNKDNPNDDIDIGVSCALLTTIDSETYISAIICESSYIDSDLFLPYTSQKCKEEIGSELSPNEHYIMKVGAYFERERGKKS